MPEPYVFYDRRNLNSTEVQFFTQSRAEATNKEVTTNMEKAYKFPKRFRVKKIVVQAPLKLVSSTTQKDTSLDDNLRILLEEAVLTFQVGDGPIRYFPVALCLGGPEITGALQYTQATAADGSYGFLNANNGGLDVDIEIPPETDIKVYIKTATTPSINPVTVYLVGEYGE